MLIKKIILIKKKFDQKKNVDQKLLIKIFFCYQHFLDQTIFVITKKYLITEIFEQQNLLIKKNIDQKKMLIRKMLINN